MGALSADADARGVSRSHWTNASATTRGFFAFLPKSERTTGFGQSLSIAIEQSAAVFRSRRNWIFSPHPSTEVLAPVRDGTRRASAAPEHEVGAVRRCRGRGRHSHLDSWRISSIARSSVESPMDERSHSES